MSISTLFLPRWGLPWAQKQPSVTPESRKRWCWRADERFPLVAPEWSAATRRFSCLCPSPPIPWPNYRPTLSPMGIDSVNWVVLFVVNDRRLIFFFRFYGRTSITGFVRWSVGLLVTHSFDDAHVAHIGLLGLVFGSGVFRFFFIHCQKLHLGFAMSECEFHCHVNVCVYQNPQPLIHCIHSSNHPSVH